MERALQNRLKASISERIATGGVLSAIGLAVVITGYFNPVTAGFFPTCPLYSMTGIYCPGCGMTRAVHALLQGDIAGAFHFNAIFPLYAFLFGYFILSGMLTVARGYGLTYKIFRPWMMFGFLGLTLAFAVMRNIPGYPFNLLAP
jgi:hypothetical protein